MSFEITRGIAAYDCPDHYATLGVAIDASAGEIRKRYLKIVRRLHPDTRGSGNDVDQASRLLSKLVNPAYETLSSEKERDEYRLLVRLVSQRVALDGDKTIRNPKAQELLEASDFEARYKTAIAELATEQYQTLSEVQTVVEQLSELNLAYLLRQEKAPQPKGSASQKFATAQTVQPQTTAPPASTGPASSPPSTSPVPNTAVAASAVPSSRPPVGSFVSQYVRRAEDLIAKNRFPQAIQELRDGLKLDPQNSQCQSLLGKIYLKQKQLKMAKIHFRQALKLNPADLGATQGMEKIAKLEKAAQANKTQAAPQASERKGLFGLFGGKK